MNFLLFVSGWVAGVIDAIGGGGGLITLPALSIALGPGVHAIGTNKMAGVAAAAVALYMYSRQRENSWKMAIIFSLLVAIGAYGGSLIAPLLPERTFVWLLSVACPIILFLLWKRDLWIRKAAVRKGRGMWVALLISGLVCGVYDGMFGPGGGTFMLLALILVAGLPLIDALVASKLANFLSASTSLVSYSAQGYVHPTTGIWVALGIGIGAWVGARLALKLDAKIVRPVLAIVCLLLILKLWLP